MKDLNKVQLTGHVGADPEVRHAENGTVVTKFTVASNRRWTDAQGEAKEETEWFNLICFNKLAEIAGDYLTKGAHVYLEGRLHTRTYEDDNGQKRYWTEVVANELIMLDKREDRADRADDQPASRQEERRERTPERSTRTPERRQARARARAEDVL